MTAPAVPPRLCPLPKVGAQLGPLPEHFVVEELPAYPLAEQGEHVFLWVEKRELNTMDVCKRLARAANVKERDVGCAGMKDKHAVTRQWLSVLYRGDDAASFDLGPGASVLSAHRHNNKLRTGHLIGNRFTITLVDANEEDHRRALEIAAYLREHGLGNYYGAQRFGLRGRNLTNALRWLNEASSAPRNPEEIAPGEGASRKEGRRGKGQKNRSRFDNKMHPSVIQSEFFNRYLTARIRDTTDELLEGEVVRLTNTGSYFVVEDVDRELPRKRAGDLILTGMLPGGKTLRSKAQAAELEREVQRQMGLSDAQMDALGRAAPGARRDLMVAPEDLTCEANANQIILGFSLPAGGYATQVLREFNEADWMFPRGADAERRSL